MKVIGENEVKLQLKESTGPMGPAGADGKDGTSVTHSWRGTTLTVTSASGTSSADLKGEKGEPGKDGKDGATGLVGPAGADGKDYVLTEADKQEIAGMVEVPGGVGAAIDDTTPSTTTTYSSQKIEDQLSALNQAKANEADLAPVAKSGSYDDLNNRPTIPPEYTLPTASASVLGGVRVGTGLTIDANGVLSLNVSNASGVSF